MLADADYPRTWNLWIRTPLLTTQWPIKKSTLTVCWRCTFWHFVYSFCVINNNCCWQIKQLPRANRPIFRNLVDRWCKFGEYALYNYPATSKSSRFRCCWVVIESIFTKLTSTMPYEIEHNKFSEQKVKVQGHGGINFVVKQEYVLWNAVSDPLPRRM